MTLNKVFDYILVGYSNCDMTLKSANIYILVGKAHISHGLFQVNHLLLQSTHISINTKARNPLSCRLQLQNCEMIHFTVAQHHNTKLSPIGHHNLVLASLPEQSLTLKRKLVIFT